jgi:PEP-CTERM motif-containing protein
MRALRIVAVASFVIVWAESSNATTITFDNLPAVTNNTQSGSTYDAQGIHISTLLSIPATVDAVGDTFTATSLSDTFWLISNAGGAGSISPPNFAAATGGLLNEVLFSFSTPITSLSLQTDNTPGEIADTVRLLGLQSIGLNQYEVIAVASGLDNATMLPANFLQVTGGPFSYAIFQTTTEQEGFDNIEFTPVPEPATLTLLSSSLAGLAYRARRKRRAAR